MATGRVPTTANSPLTAKGDLFGYSTTQARVAVGNDGETLVADSSTSTGLRYIPAPNVSNPVLNSAFDIWQRGTSFASGARIYGPDRFYFLRGGLAGGVTVSRQVTGDTTNLPNVQYSCRVQRDSGNTSTAATYLYQEFETVNSIPFAGRTVTLSFYARRGANYSPASNGLYFELVSGTGTDQNIFTGFTGGVAVGSTTATLTTTWQRFTFTGTVPTNSTQLGFYTGFSAAVGTAGAADFFEITGIQIDVGAVPLPFRRNGATIQGELAACQRYYYASNAGICTAGIAPSGAFIYGRLVHPVPMRTTPSGSISPSGTTFTVTDDYSAAFSSSAVTGFGNDSWITSTSARVSLSGFTGLTGGRFYSVDGRSAGQIMFSAEL